MKPTVMAEHAANPMKGQMRKIKIDGKDHPFGGLTENREGIITGGTVHWMYPAVRCDGGSLETLPRIGPREIKRVTTEVPDLTAEFPDTVKEIFVKRRDYHAAVTRKKHIEQYPQDESISPEEFEEARRRIANQSLEEFTRSRRAREAVWQRHGTKDRAEQVGLLSDCEQIMVVECFKRAGMNKNLAWRELAKLRYAADYGDPDKTRIYLYDLIEEPDPKAAEMELKRREIEAQERRAAAPAGAPAEQSEIAEMGKRMPGVQPSGATQNTSPELAVGFESESQPGIKVPLAQGNAYLMKWGGIAKHVGEDPDSKGFKAIMEDQPKWYLYKLAGKGRKKNLLNKQAFYDSRAFGSQEKQGQSGVNTGEPG